MLRHGTGGIWGAGTQPAVRQWPNPLRVGRQQLAPQLSGKPGFDNSAESEHPSADHPRGAEPAKRFLKRRPNADTVHLPVFAASAVLVAKELGGYGWIYRKQQPRSASDREPGIVLQPAQHPDR